MRPLSPVLASLANVFKIPLSQTTTRPAVSRVYNEAAVTKNNTTGGTITAAIQPTASRTFSTTSALCKRKPTGSMAAAQAGRKISRFHPCPHPSPIPQSPDFYYYY